MKRDTEKAKHYFGTRLVLPLSALLIIAFCPAVSAAPRIAKLTATFTAVPAPKTTLRVAALSSVACTSRQFCVAVGPNYGEEAAEKAVSAPTVIDQFNGSVWTKSQSPSPSAQLNILDSVSCLSSTFCLAVGGDDVHGTEVPLTERFNGHSWSVVSSSALYPPDTYSTSKTVQLNSVSCVSASFCMTVGVEALASSQSKSTQSFTVQGKFNGTKLVDSLVTGHAVGFSGELDAVSCVSKTSCMAGGELPPVSASPTSSTPPTGPMVASVAHYNGKSWGSEEYYDTPFNKFSSSGITGSSTEITGVSCVKGLFRGTVPSTMGRLCLVEGFGIPDGRYTPFAGYVTLASGVEQESPVTFAHRPGLYPNGVACLSSGCVVVGDVDAASSPGFAAIFTGAWSLRPTAAPPGGDFTGVACVGTWCVAVGTETGGKSPGGALIEQTA